MALENKMPNMFLLMQHVVELRLKKQFSATDLGFNFTGCAMSRTHEYKWNWEFGGNRGGECKSLVGFYSKRHEEKNFKIKTCPCNFE